MIFNGFTVAYENRRFFVCLLTKLAYRFRYNGAKISTLNIEMNKYRLAWAITGSGHYIEECPDFLLTLDDVDLYLSPAAEEVIKMYGMNFNDIRKKMPVYRDKTASSPPVGHFYKAYYHTFVIAPATSNTAAKCVAGIADSLVTNLYSQAGKCRVPSIVYPCDIAPEMETTAPGGKKVMVYPRKIDLEVTSKLSTFEYTSVVKSVDELIVTVKERLAFVSRLCEPLIKLSAFAASPEGEC
jgi:dihydromethanopterin reductase (acceptor)